MRKLLIFVGLFIIASISTAVYSNDIASCFHRWSVPVKHVWYHKILHVKYHGKHVIHSLQHKTKNTCLEFPHVVLQPITVNGITFNARTWWTTNTPSLPSLTLQSIDITYPWVATSQSNYINQPVTNNWYTTYDMTSYWVIMPTYYISSGNLPPITHIPYLGHRPKPRHPIYTVPEGSMPWSFVPLFMIMFAIVTWRRKRYHD